MRSASASRHDAQALAEGAVQVLLHVAQGDRGAGRDALGEREGLLREVGVGHHAIHDPEPLALARVEPVAGEVDLARPGGADQPGQEPAAAVVAREPELRVGGGHEGALRGDAQIAGEREREAGPGGGPGQRRERRLLELEERRDDPVLPAQLALALLGRSGPSLARHQLGVAAGAEGAARAGEQHAAHAGVRAERGDQPGQRLLHLERERVARLGAVQRHARDARLEPAQDLLGPRLDRRAALALGHGILPRHRLSPPRATSRRIGHGSPGAARAGREPAAAGDASTARP